MFDFDINKLKHKALFKLIQDNMVSGGWIAKELYVHVCVVYAVLTFGKGFWKTCMASTIGAAVVQL